MIGINPATAYLLLNRYVSLMPGDWIGQTAANSAMGQYIIKLAKLAGVKTLNVVRREEAAKQVRQLGGDRVVLQGDNLHKDIEEALGGKTQSRPRYGGRDSRGGIKQVAQNRRLDRRLCHSHWAIPCLLAL
jgi:NADPH:quinone reductase-like Zn-dependent oxidoreductase